MLKRLLTAAALVALVACASTPDDDKTNLADTAAADDKVRVYRESGGPHPVGVIPNGVVNDPKRNKNIDVSIEYPTKAGPHPVIIFSHGYGGSNRAYVGLSAHWASYGYIVIKPTHADSGVVTLRDAMEVWDDQKIDDHRNRVADISAIIDALPALEQKYPELQGKIDREKIGVGGHSYGALTALMAGGAKLFMDGSPTVTADSRVDAVIAMSPQGTEPKIGLTNDSWSEIRVPTLYLTGTRDAGVGGREPAWRREPFEHSAAGEKWFISIPGARHSSFLGRVASEEAFRLGRGKEDEVKRPDPDEPPPTTTPQPRVPGTSVPPDERGGTYGRRGADNARARTAALEEMRQAFGTIKLSSAAFWDTYLRNEPEGRKYLEGLRERKGFEVATR